MTRLFPGLCLLPLLAACGGDRTAAEQEAATAQGDDTPVCSIGGAQDWSPDCTLERDGDVLTIRHPDGGFRRFRVLADGRGLKEADGAEAVQLRIVGDHMLEASVGDDRYRLPVKIAGPAQ